MTKEKPFSAIFKLEKETENTVRYAEEAQDRRSVVGTVYIDKYELPYPADSHCVDRVDNKGMLLWVSPATRNLGGVRTLHSLVGHRIILDK